MATKPLTQKQADALEFIIARIEEGLGVPTFRELGQKFNLKSTVSPKDFIEALERKGG